MSSVNDNLPSPCRLGPNYPTSLLSTMIRRHLVVLNQVCLCQNSGWPPSSPSTIISIPASNPICVCRFAGIPSSLSQNHIFPILCRSHFHFSPTFLLPILPSTINHSYLHKQPHFLVVSGHLTWPSFVHITIASRFPKGPRRTMALYFQLLSTVAFHLRSFSMPR
jgi:hypothetical protein